MEMGMRSCFSKVRCRTEAEASRRADRASKKLGKTLRPYYCGMCCGFHMTSQPTMADRLDAELKRESEAPKNKAKTGAERFSARVAKWHRNHNGGK